MGQEPELIGDRYDVKEPIGRGGMATIYRAVDLRMGRLVAVKVLREVYSSDPKFVTRFQREARAASALQHPNIVQVFDYGQSGESYYIVMEYINGTDLRRYLKKRGQLDNDRAVEIAHDVALGLGAAHKRGIVHRDVKPQNIMLNDEGLVKLTDFGIASMYKDAEAERLTTTGMTLGTVQYYAPEQAQGEIVSPSADIYALGIVMYEMLTGKTPFDGDTPVAVAMHHIQDAPEPPSSLNPRISPALERIILRCLEKDPRDRYKDGDALAYALENYARGGASRRTGVGTGVAGPNSGPFGVAGPMSRPGVAVGPGARPMGVSAGPAVHSGPRPSRMGMNSGMGPQGVGLGAPGGFDDPTVNDFNEFPGPGAISTRPFGPAAGTVPRVTGVGQRPDQQPRRNGPLIATIVVSVLTLLLLACVLVGTLTGGIPALLSVFSSPTATPGPKLTLVPSLLNLTCDQATQSAQAKGFKVNCVQTTNATVTKGLVFQQEPPANSQAQAGATIILSVSSGPGTVPVPDVTKMTVADACTQLNKVQLQCTTGSTVPSTLPAGQVVSTDPPANTPVAPQTTVTLTVSAGAPTPTTPPVTPTPSISPTPSPTA